jgi:REP element-mobilizing transposase RayT
MPRCGRMKSETGIYHVMLRGINQQVIFEDDEDCEKMLQTLIDVKAVSKCKIFAYCLMQNHVHFVLKEEEEGVDQIFRRVGARYVYWYNVKYKRTGHLFQDRFKSEVINDNNYLLTVLRYVHQNPIKAGLCENLSEYPWSSYKEYIGKPTMVDTEYIYEIVDRKGFDEFSKTETGEKILEYEQRAYRISDTEAKMKMQELSGCNSAAMFQKLDLGERKMYLREFKKAGISIRQINRLTGISKGIVERA